MCSLAFVAVLLATLGGCRHALTSSDSGGATDAGEPDTRLADAAGGDTSVPDTAGQPFGDAAYNDAGGFDAGALAAYGVYLGTTCPAHQIAIGGGVDCPNKDTINRSHPHSTDKRQWRAGCVAAGQAVQAYVICVDSGDATAFYHQQTTADGTSCGSNKSIGAGVSCPGGPLAAAYPDSPNSVKKLCLNGTSSHRLWALCVKNAAIAERLATSNVSGTTSAIAPCPTGHLVVGGGCTATDIEASHPHHDGRQWGWACRGATAKAYAVCLRP